jgi:hypothetical protein
MPNFLESFLAPNYAQYRAEQDAERRGIASSGASMQRFRNYLDMEERQGISHAISYLGRTGQLSNTALSQSVAALGQAKLMQLGSAQMQADSAREAARLRYAQLGDYAKTALVGDIANDVVKAGSMAVSGYLAATPMAQAAVKANPTLGIAAQAAKPGMQPGHKFLLAGLADAFGNTGGANLGLVKEEQAQGQAEQSRNQAAFDKAAMWQILGFDPSKMFGVGAGGPEPVKKPWETNQGWLP